MAIETYLCALKLVDLNLCALKLFNLDKPLLFIL